jgi:ketosteroid isomerase-like protein
MDQISDNETRARLLKCMRESWSSMDVENMRATNSGGQVLQPFAEVLKIRDGLVIEGTPYYHDTAEIRAAFGGGRK